MQHGGTGQRYDNIRCDRCSSLVFQRRAIAQICERLLSYKPGGGECLSSPGGIMAKVENLVLLLNLLYHRRAVDVKTMVRACNISKRTAYRYVRSLETAGFPVYFDDNVGGYRLTDKSGSFSRLSPEESATVLFALEFLECSFSPDRFGPIHRARMKLQLHLSGEMPGLLAETLTATSTLDEMSPIKEMLIVTLVRFACHLKKSIKIYHHTGNDSNVLTEIRSPRLIYDKEWKVNDESVDDCLGQIPIRRVVNIEVV
ncbi:MAG: HTH domain-containing protein [Candidatus Zixiibacteriota bacterium]|nr:MAG: HTH domain-containing protein [candidate division Zixibacteria bacterium]